MHRKLPPRRLKIMHGLKPCDNQQLKQPKPGRRRRKKQPKPRRRRREKLLTRREIRRDGRLLRCRRLQLLRRERHELRRGEKLQIVVIRRTPLTELLRRLLRMPKRPKQMPKK